METDTPNRSEKNAKPPIAIVGIGCRFPGGITDAASCWDFLMDGKDAITEVPSDRWHADSFYAKDTAAFGRMNTKWGGFIDDFAEFDAGFFGIPPREAVRLDPQQRWLMEVSWEALEDSCIAPSRIRESRTGVFVGIAGNDYRKLQVDYLATVDLHTNIGNTSSIAANRISYFFDLKGPSLAVDTACSSAMVAIHLGCQSIWSGESEAALAGGVNSLLIPESTIGFSKASMLSPNGRCHAFDQRADGYVRAEGLGMLYLKPEADAIRDGNPIYAVIRSSVVNQDGKTSSMPVPSLDLQKQMLQDALESANVSHEDVAYIEAHGTGTPVGDPIEARALGEAITAPRRSGDNCLIGSIKTNIGHLECASGVAGIIKAALVLKHREIPRNLHFSTPNPTIHFEELNLSVVDENCTLPTRGRENPIAVVNSFGFGGTNGCVVLEAAGQNGGASVEDAAAGETSYFLPLSAKGENALRETAGRFRAFLEGTDDSMLGCICRSAAEKRERHGDRLVVYGKTKAEIAALLENFEQTGEEETGLVAGNGLIAGTAPVFVYTGQGAQWWGMGQQLLREEPVFRNAVAEVDRIFQKVASRSLLEEMTKCESESKIHETWNAQPALFALQVGLTELWKSRGVIPAKVIGHSVGEVAASWAAGIHTLEEATKIVFHRSRLQGSVNGNGAMAVAGVSPEDVEETLKAYGETIEIAAFNDPALLTLAGDADDLGELLAELESKGKFVRRLPIPFAFHSRQMNPIEEDLIRELSGIEGREGTIPFLSTVSGRQIRGTELGPDYWWRNVRQPVDFAGAVQSAIDQGEKLFVEIGPHPALSRSVSAALADSRIKGFAIPSLYRERDEKEEILRDMATLILRGGEVEWESLYPKSSNETAVRLPSYCWQRERFWLEREIDRRTRLEPYCHPLLGHRTDSPSPIWEVRLDPRVLEYLADHKFWDRIVFPVAAFTEIAIAAARELHPDEKWVVEDLEIERILFVSSEQIPHLRIECDEREDSKILIYSQHADSEPWNLHVICTIGPEISGPESDADLSALRDSLKGHVAHWDFYENLREAGYPYGQVFRGVEQIFYNAGESLAEIVVPAEISDELGNYHFHPAVLDSCFQAFRGGLIGLEEEFPEESNSGRFYLPGGIRSFRMFADVLPKRFWVHTKIVDVSGKSVLADLCAYDRKGRHLASVRMFRLDESPNNTEGNSSAGMFYQLRWEAEPDDVEETAVVESENIIVVSPESRYAAKLLDIWGKEGHRTIRLQIPESDSPVEDLRASIDELGWEIEESPVVVFLGAFQNLGENEPSLSELSAAQSGGVLDAVTLIGAMAGADLTKKGAQLYFPSWCAKPGQEGSVPAVASTPMLGLMRVAASEHPEFSPRWIELDSDDPENSITDLAREIRADGEESEVSYKDGVRFGRRLRRVAKEGLPRRAKRVSREPEVSFRLETDRPGDLSRLAFHEFQNRELHSDELEIRVEAVGLNFRDLMKALAMYPGSDQELQEFGDDFSGTVTRIGDSVTKFAPGDSVTGIAPHALASQIIATEATVFPTPPDLSHKDAATVPTVFLTAEYCLRSLARMQPGESILIHSGGGGVGQAAIQIAQSMGLNIFTTAGSEEKRDELRKMGIAHVFSSRDLEFSDRILEITEGRGVDAVLNSLAGAFLVKSLSILAPYGRFLEIGKVDIYANRKVALKAMRENISYFVVDMARFFHERQKEAVALVEQIQDRFASGEYKALPYRLFPGEEIEAAFRWMASGSHFGKIVIDLTSETIPILPASDGHGFIHDDRSYLIAGGAEGFGLKVAAHLARHGARHLALLSRNGPKTDAAAGTIERLKQEGVEILDIRADLCDEGSVESAFAEIKAKQPPLSGVFHSAMVVNDGMISELGHEDFREALDPKLLGAWNLHLRTRELDLDHFVCFSSFSGIVGGLRQSNYNAGNVFLDSLAHYRRALGLPALSVNWGPLVGAGYLERNEKSKQYMEAVGAESFQVEEAVEILHQLLHVDVPQIMACRFDWQVAHRIAPAVASSNLFGEVREEAISGDWAGSIQPILRAAPEEQRQKIVEDYLLSQIAVVFGAAREKLDPETPITQLGLDSLMSIELVNRLESNLGIPIPLGTILNGPTVRELSADLLRTLLDADLDDDSDRHEETSDTPEPAISS